MATIHPQLSEIVDELARASAGVHALADAVDGECLRTRPSEGAWSISECIAHLALTTRAYLPIIDAALSTPGGDLADRDHRFKADLVGRILRWTIEPPYRIRVRTLAPFVPASVAGRDEVLREFDASQAELVERVHAADGHALDRLRIASPFNARMKYNLYSCLTILPAHQRRHLWQAEKVKEHLGRADDVNKRGG